MSEIPIPFVYREELPPPLLELALWEVDLLVLIASGATGRMAAHRLGVSERTVRRRLQQWSDQVGAGSVTHLIAWAVEVQLVRLPVARSRVSIAFRDNIVQVWGEQVSRQAVARFGALPLRHTMRDALSQPGRAGRTSGRVAAQGHQAARDTGAAEVRNANDEKGHGK